MAKVISPTKFRGTIADMTFRITEDGNIAGKKPGPSREKVLSHDNFKRTRLNAAEFQLAIKDAQLLRRSLSAALDGMTGSSLNGRMNGLFYSIAQQDQVSDLGSRRAANGDVSLLKGFDFNKGLLLKEAWGLRFVHSLNVATGVFNVTLPSFIARKRKVFPMEATHFRIISGGVAVNFIRSHCKGKSSDIKTSELLPLRKKTPGPICFEHQVEVREGEVLVQVLGVEFYKLVNGREVLVKGSALRVLEAVKTGIKATRYQGSELQADIEEGLAQQAILLPNPINNLHACDAGSGWYNISAGKVSSDKRLRILSYGNKALQSPGSVGRYRSRHRHTGGGDGHCGSGQLSRKRRRTIAH